MGNTVSLPLERSQIPLYTKETPLVFYYGNEVAIPSEKLYQTSMSLFGTHHWVAPPSQYEDLFPHK